MRPRVYDNGHGQGIALLLEGDWRIQRSRFDFQKRYQVSQRWICLTIQLAEPKTAKVAHTFPSIDLEQRDRHKSTSKA